MAPTLVPTTMSGLRPCDSSALMTPTWANPRADPPDSTRATQFGFAQRWASMNCGSGPRSGGGVNVAQPAIATSIPAAMRFWSVKDALLQVVGCGDPLHDRPTLTQID